MCGGDDRIGALNKKVVHGDYLKVLMQNAVCFNFDYLFYWRLVGSVGRVPDYCAG